MVHRSSWRTILAVMAMACLLVAGCAGQDRAQSAAEPVSTTTTVPKPKPGGRIVYGIESDPNGLDPTRNAWDTAGILLANALYDPIAAFDAQGHIQPYLVESFTPAADFRSWTFTLRPDVSFHSGAKLDAPAMAVWLQKLRDSGITGPAAKLIRDVRVLDARTLVLAMSRPWASLPALLTGQGGFVVSPTQLADPKTSGERPDGTGPFKLRHWDIDKQFELVRNPNYWRKGLPYLDAVNFQVQSDGNQRAQAIERGDMDIAGFSYPAELTRIKAAAQRSEAGDRRFNLERDASDAPKEVVVLNTTKAPLDDVRIRQALSYATDARSLGEQHGWDLSLLGQGPFSPDSPFYSPAPYPAFDLDKAKALVRAYKAEKHVKDVSFTLTGSVQRDFLNQLVDQWALAGFKVKLDRVEPKTATRVAVLGSFEALQLRYYSANDPDVLWHFFVSETITPGGASLNFARMADPDVDAGMNDGRASPDLTVRRRAYAQVQAAMARDMAYIWLTRSEWQIASVARVHNAHNVTLPDGQPAMPFLYGTHNLTETWIGT
jgi:peptide/nickel transport system substrate-binding protein